MQIGSGAPISTKTSVSTPTAIPYRTGDVVVVQAVKIQAITSVLSEVLLKFPNGETLTTNFKDMFKGKEGEYFPIKIQSKTDKQVFAEIVRSQEGVGLKKNSIINLLSSLNISSTPENYQIAMQMIKNGITKSSQKFNSISQLIKQYPNLSLEQIILMVKKEIPFNEQTTSTIVSLTSHENLIGEELLLLFQSIMVNDEKSSELITLLKGFYRNPEDKEFDSNQLKTDKTLTDLVKILQALKEKNIFNGKSNENTNVDLFTKKTENQLDIMQKFNSDLTYLQIPLNTNGFFSTAELYISNDEKNENEISKQWSLFLRIPTASLGLVELFLHIDSNKNFQCHFNTEELIDIKDLHSNIMKLYDGLGDIGYHLAKVSYNQIPSGISLGNFHTYADLIMSDKKFDERI